MFRDSGWTPWNPPYSPLASSPEEASHVPNPKNSWDWKNVYPPFNKHGSGTRPPKEDRFPLTGGSPLPCFREGTHLDPGHTSQNHPN